MKSLLLFYGILFLSLSCLAKGGGNDEGIMIRPAGMYWSTDFKNGFSPTSNTAIRESTVSVGLGYRLDTGIYIGGTYTWMQQENKTETSTSTTETKSSHTGYGPTLGIVGTNIYLLGTYIVSPVYTSGTDSSKTTYSGGTGYQVDLGVMFGLGSGVGIGPQFTYYSVTFKKAKNAAGNEIDLDGSSATDIRPLLAFAFSF